MLRDAVELAMRRGWEVVDQ